MAEIVLKYVLNPACCENLVTTTLLCSDTNSGKRITKYTGKDVKLNEKCQTLLIR